MKPDLKNYSTSPGVYIMKDAEGRVLYIGKAINLRKRVAAYFGREVKERYQIKFLMERVASIETIKTRSEKEALLLEYKLIQEHRPKYNIDLKDNKTFLRVKVTIGHAFPAIFLTRHIRKDGAEYFGPYVSAAACRDMVDEIEKYFKLRTCSDREFANRSRPCIEFDMGRCTAPCVGHVGKEAYAEQVRGAILLLKGHRKEILKELKKKMKVASAAMKFEEAARLRDLIKDIRRSIEKQGVMKAGEICHSHESGELDHILEVPASAGMTGIYSSVIGSFLKRRLRLKDIPHFIECVDISNIQGKAACGGIVCFLDGSPFKARYRLFNIDRGEEPNKLGNYSSCPIYRATPNDYAMMHEVLERRFGHEEWGTPDLLLVDGGRGQLSIALEVLKNLKIEMPVASIAKIAGSHKKGSDVAQIFLPNRINPVNFKKGDPSLLYLIRIRDEAHRFVIRQYRRRHSISGASV